MTLKTWLKSLFNGHKKADEKVEEALMESFPASDPPATGVTSTKIPSQNSTDKKVA